MLGIVCSSMPKSASHCLIFFWSRESKRLFMYDDLISIIMSVYNEPHDWLEKSIESILNQSYRNLEFIIVLDNPENSVSRNFIEKYQKKDDRIVFLVNDINRGLAYSLNRGLEVARGEYIARMDADDISHFDRIERQLKYIKNFNLDLMGSNVNLFNNNGIFYTTNKLQTHKYLTKILMKGTIGIVHPTFFGRKEVFKRLKGYDQFALHIEDKDFLARAICAGFRVGNTKDVLLDCRYNTQSVTKNNAIYISSIGKHISKVFRECVHGKKRYDLDHDFVKNLHFSQEDIVAYNKKQRMLGDAREALTHKRYLLFADKIVRSLIHSYSAFDSIKVNLFLGWYRFLENIELRHAS